MSPRKRTRPRRGGVRAVVRKGLWGLLWLVLIGVVALVIAYVLIDSPNPNDRAVAQASILYYADGETEMDRIATVNRESVDLDQVPVPVQRAFLSAEDRSFYENEGVSPTGILRAVKVAVSGGPQQGGSTITQQYVKNYFLSQDQTLVRKAKEVLISVKIDQQLSKDEILANYLNTIYFGRGADGIQTASQAYFGKDVDQLTVSEGAFLASVVNGPSLYDPSLGDAQRKRAEDRWNYVLDGMVEQGWMTAAERDRQTFPKVDEPRRQHSSSDDIGFVTEEVREELRTKVGLSEADIARGGFKIVTTIDQDAQQAAAKAVDDARPEGSAAKDVHIGLAAVEPGDGAVRAMYGGAAYGQGRSGYFNAAVDGKMQAGSTMKPFTIIAALRDGMPLSTTFSGDSPYYDSVFVYDGPGATQIQREGGIVNYGNQDYGPVDMREATKRSINTYFARLNLAVGPKQSAEVAKVSGVKAWNGDKRIPLSSDPTNVFGTDAVRVIDMAGAYATIAAQGRHAEPYYISSVEGDFDYEVEPDVERVYPQDVARDTIQAMSRVDSPGGTGYPTVAELDRPVGGKTGTTSGNYAAWFDGFTPGQLSAAVGMYKGDGRLVEANRLEDIGGYAEVTGGTIPADIWTDFMIGALEGEPVKELPPAGHVTSSSRSSTPPDAPTPLPTSTTPEPTSTDEPTSSTSTRTSTTKSSTSSSSRTTRTTTSTSSSSSSSSTKQPTSTSSTSTSPTTTPPPTSSSTSPPAPTQTRPTTPTTTLTTPPPASDEARTNRSEER